MRVTPDDSGAAILRIFFDVRVTRAGAALLRSDLAAAWPLTGLRHHDLSDGLDRLCAQRSLQRVACQETDDELITVLPAGEARITGSPQSWRERLAALRCAWVLRRATWRARHGKFLRRVRCSVLGHHPDFDAKDR